MGTLGPLHKHGWQVQSSGVSSLQRRSVGSVIERGGPGGGAELRDAASWEWPWAPRVGYDGRNSKNDLKGWKVARHLLSAKCDRPKPPPFLDTLKKWGVYENRGPHIQIS